MSSAALREYREAQLDLEARAAGDGAAKLWDRSVYTLAARERLDRAVEALVFEGAQQMREAQLAEREWAAPSDIAREVMGRAAAEAVAEREALVEKTENPRRRS